MSSCALFKGGQYADQVEVQTDVPESLEKGKPSKGPPAGAAELHTVNSGVPPTSNLMEAADPWQPTGQPALPGKSQPGGASISAAPSEGTRDLIDIPKPEFTNVSLHNPATRPPAEMLSLGPPTTPATARMSLGGSGTRSDSLPVISEPVAPLSPAPAPAAEPETATTPKPLVSTPAEPGVPLLHSATSLSDFYQGIHGELLNATVVEVIQPPAEPVATPAPGDTLAVPPPPPEDSSPGTLP
jgi:hypothetical protein